MKPHVSFRSGFEFGQPFRRDLLGNNEIVQPSGGRMSNTSGVGVWTLHESPEVCRGLGQQLHTSGLNQRGAHVLDGNAKSSRKEAGSNLRSGSQLFIIVSAMINQPHLGVPGIYLNEVTSSPGSMVEVPTAIPAFIGYTARALYYGRDLVGKPVKIVSLADFLEMFGLQLGEEAWDGQNVTFDQKQYTPVYHLVLATGGVGDVNLNGQSYELLEDPGSIYYLYNSLKLFYENGGGTCYVVTAGIYGQPTGRTRTVGAPLVNPNVKYNELKTALDALALQQDPTMVIIPDALLLGFDQYSTLMQDVLAQCGKLEDRIGLFDVYGGQTPNPTTYFEEQITPFRNAVGKDNLGYGTAYYPFLNTTVVHDDVVNFNTLGGARELQSVLPDAGVDPVKTILDTILNPPSQNPPSADSLETVLMQSSPSYRQLHNLALTRINTLPVAAAMAGVYTMLDNRSGVWTAPANVGLNGVVDTTLRISDEMQSALNVDPLAGKSVNAIRLFAGKGVLVWGARTLDGNSQDWRFINVRRLVIMIVQSIKLALKSFVFQPNTNVTWMAVTQMLDGFLTNLCKEGALVGPTPSSSFNVSVGSGSTMTADDILNGIMRVTVQLAVTHPAEFLVLTFEQQMATG